MKKLRIAIALALSVLMLFSLLAACSGGGNENATDSTPTPAPANNSGGNNTPPPDDLVVEKTDEMQLPIVEETVTFTIWQPIDPSVTDQFSNLNESDYYKELERRTNVHVEFIHPAMGNESEALNIMWGTGEYPDCVQLMPGGYDYPGGLDKGIEDGTIIDLNELAEQYAPNYYAEIFKNDETRRELITDEHNIPGFWQIQIFQPPWYGMTVRQDWLDDLGLETPVTYDDWYIMLTRFKNEKGAAAPMSLFMTGYPLYEMFTAGFDYGTSWYQVDGKVQFGPLAESNKEYLQMMNKWFSEGLIDPDFASNANWIGNSQDLTTGRNGVWPDVYIMFPVDKSLSTDPNFRAVALPIPVKEKGQTVHFAQRNQMAGFIWVLTDNCKDPVTFTKWMDYNYTTEGSLLANLGVEGISFEYNADGEAVPNENMYANPNGLDLAKAIRKYAKMPSGGFIYDWRREMVGQTQDTMDALDIWGSNTDYAWMLPQITLTADEGAESATIMGDIDTYVTEMTVKFITGAESFDNYDKFIANLHTMGIDRAIELRQGALDRYNKR